MMDTTDGNIGHILKERREELGRSLQDAADATRIRKTYLESLENDHFSDLPGQTYVKGFIRVYAAYLGLKSNSLIARFNELEGAAGEPAASVPAAVSKPGPPVERAADADWRKFFLAFLLVLALGCLLFYLLASDSSETPLDDREKNAVSSAAEQTAADQPPAHSAPGQAVPVAPRVAEKGPVESQAAADPMPAGVEQQGRDGRSYPAIPPQGASLRMLALTESSLIIKVDAREPQQYKLHEGLDLTWKIKQGVSAEFAASDVARFWLNGTEIDIAGEMSFTLEPAAE